MASLTDQVRWFEEKAVMMERANRLCADLLIKIAEMTPEEAHDQPIETLIWRAELKWNELRKLVAWAAARAAAVRRDQIEKSCAELKELVQDHSQRGWINQLDLGDIRPILTKHFGYGLAYSGERIIAASKALQELNQMCGAREAPTLPAIEAKLREYFPLGTTPWSNWEEKFDEDFFMDTDNGTGPRYLFHRIKDVPHADSTIARPEHLKEFFRDILDSMPCVEPNQSVEEVTREWQTATGCANPETIMRALANIRESLGCGVVEGIPDGISKLKRQAESWADEVQELLEKVKHLEENLEAVRSTRAAWQRVAPGAALPVGYMILLRKGYTLVSISMCRVSGCTAGTAVETLAYGPIPEEPPAEPEQPQHRKYLHKETMRTYIGTFHEAANRVQLFDKGRWFDVDSREVEEVT